MSTRVLIILTVVLVASAAQAATLTILTTGKQAVFRADQARVRVGRDPRLKPLADPQCGGVETRIQLAAYPQATARLDPQDEVVLPCANWKRAGKGYLYKDATGAAGGVTRVLYSAKRLQVHFGGAAYVPLSGPVGYAELWFTVGPTRFLARFHNFTRNTATELVTLKASKPAAQGEAAFWEVLLGDDKSDANQIRSLDLLEKATNRNRKDGRSPFLCGMMHLYRHGLFFDDAGQPTTASRVEIDGAVAAFDVAGPRVWDDESMSGDSRVPGFVATAKFSQGYAYGDEDRMNEGLADLQAAVAINPFFNVFDLIPVLMQLPRTDPRWQAAYDQVVTYLEDPDTIACVATQPEICANQGFAPHNTGGSLVLFGDVYTKAARPESLERATFWYGLATVIGGEGWPFQDVADARLADIENRIARYLDDDPSNDDLIIGTRAENCAVCHNR